MLFFICDKYPEINAESAPVKFVLLWNEFDNVGSQKDGPYSRVALFRETSTPPVKLWPGMITLAIS